jgi:hypothetical protein
VVTTSHTKYVWIYITQTQNDKPYCTAIRSRGAAATVLITMRHEHALAPRWSQSAAAAAIRPPARERCSVLKLFAALLAVAVMTRGSSRACRHFAYAKSHKFNSCVSCPCSKCIWLVRPAGRPNCGGALEANKRNVQKMHCIGVLLRFTLRALFRAVASHANGTLTRGGVRVPQSVRSRAEGSYECRPAFTSASAASVVCTAPHVSAQRAGGSPPRFVRSRSEH